MIKTFLKTAVNDFERGTDKVSALIGFLNLFVLLSVWEERIGIPPIQLFGSSAAVYIFIIYAVGHYTPHIEKIEEAIKK